MNNDRVDVTALTIEARPEFERLHVVRKKINDLRAPSAAAALLCSQDSQQDGARERHLH